MRKKEFNSETKRKTREGVFYCCSLFTQENVCEIRFNKLECDESSTFGFQDKFHDENVSRRFRCSGGVFKFSRSLTTFAEHTLLHRSSFHSNSTQTSMAVQTSASPFADIASYDKICKTHTLLMQSRASRLNSVTRVAMTLWKVTGMLERQSQLFEIFTPAVSEQTIRHPEHH